MTYAYLAGPMTGYDNFNYDAFDKATKMLRHIGWRIFNPTEVVNGEQGHPFSHYLRLDIAAILEVDAVVVLPGWETSAGARLEVAMATALGKPTYAFTDILRDPGFEDELWKPDHQATCDLVNGRLPGQDEPVTPKETVLQEADRLVATDRQADYGHPLDDFTRTAGMWTSMFAHKLLPGARFEPEDYALAMVAVKISRELNRPKRDNRVDGPGYFKCLDLVISERERRATGD